MTEESKPPPSEQSEQPPAPPESAPTAEQPETPGQAPPAPQTVEPPAAEPPAAETPAVETPAAEPPPAEAPAAETTPPPWSAALDPVLDALRDLQQSFDDKLRYDEAREQIITQLHQEVQQYRQDLHLKILRKALTDMIDIHDEIGKTVRAFREKIAKGDSVAVDAVLRSVEGLQVDVEDALARHGVEAFQTDGDQFDPKSHRALKTVPCEQEQDHGRIVERLRKGFAYEGKVLRPEVVTVLKFQKPPAAANQ